MNDLLLLAVAVLTVAAMPVWPYSRHWGLAPSGAMAVGLGVAIVLTLSG
jgi:hypothetical protein